MSWHVYIFHSNYLARFLHQYIFRMKPIHQIFNKKIQVLCFWFLGGFLKVSQYMPLSQCLFSLVKSLNSQMPLQVHECFFAIKMCDLNGSVRGRVSSSRKRFWTLPNLYLEVSEPNIIVFILVLYANRVEGNLDTSEP